MGQTKASFNIEDIELAKFTRALALPVRIAILRILLKNNDWIASAEFKSISLNAEVVERHLNGLKSLGLVDRKMQAGVKYYRVNIDNFKRLAYHFSVFSKSFSVK